MLYSAGMFRPTRPSESIDQPSVRKKFGPNHLTFSITNKLQERESMINFKRIVPILHVILCLSFTVLWMITQTAFAENTVSTASLSSLKEADQKQQATSKLETPLYAIRNVFFEKEKTEEPVQEKEPAKTNHPETKDNPDEDEKMEVAEEQDLMDNALEILEVADAYWKNGDIENTLNELDKAYALVLDTNGEVEIARQKDDLRLLISKRILAVYSSQQTRTNGKHSEIQLLMNADVEKEIRSFQGYEREFFMASYERSGMFKDIIVNELKKAGVPEELFWLPLVESGFKVSAYSSARALGLWQFIPSTGYKFGLTRDEWVDERMDILKSTHAAIAYLKELHSMFGDWLTVLAAYNCGEGRVLRVISRQHINYFDRFWDLYSKLPNETARYVPRFLATLHIVKNPDKYGFTLPLPKKSLMAYETIKVQKIMKLSDVAEKMEIPEETICVLNAELRSKMTPDREYAIKVPQGMTEKFNLVYNDIPEGEKPSVRYAGSSTTGPTGKKSSYIRHRVRPGETVASIAKRYRVSRQSIYQSNRISKNRRLAKGRIIQIPISQMEAADGKEQYAAKNKGSRTSASVKIYKVKRGDSLAGIAGRYAVSVSDLKKINNLKSNKVKVGGNLKIPSASTENENPSAKVVTRSAGGKKITAKDMKKLGSNKHIVTKGENLAGIARKYHVQLAKLKKMNNLSGNDPIAPGQILIVKK